MNRFIPLILMRGRLPGQKPRILPVRHWYFRLRHAAWPAKIVPLRTMRNRESAANAGKAQPYTHDGGHRPRRHQAITTPVQRACRIARQSVQGRARCLCACFQDAIASSS